MCDCVCAVVYTKDKLQAQECGRNMKQSKLCEGSSVLENCSDQVQQGTQTMKRFGPVSRSVSDVSLIMNKPKCLTRQTLWTH